MRKCLSLDKTTDDPGRGSTRITQFSDSVVISFRYDEESGVFQTLLTILHLSIGLVAYGVICRGGISLGSLIHTDELLFGPALIDAYQLESKAANYPRVILDESIIAVSETYHASHHSPEDESEYVRNLVKRDSDGMYYVDYIDDACSGEFDDPETGYPAYLEILCQIIKEGLKSTDPSVRVKYSWLRERYNVALQKMKEACLTRKIRDPVIVAAYKSLEILNGD